MGRWGGGALYFLGCRIAYKGAMGGARGGEYYISKPRLYSGNIRPWQPRSSFRVRRNSVGCRIDQKGTEYPEGAA
jgi:hypothetical protein